MHYFHYFSWKTGEKRLLFQERPDDYDAIQQAPTTETTDTPDDSISRLSALTQQSESPEQNEQIAQEISNVAGERIDTSGTAVDQQYQQEIMAVEHAISFMQANGDDSQELQDLKTKLEAREDNAATDNPDRQIDSDIGTAIADTPGDVSTHTVMDNRDGMTLEQFNARRESFLAAKKIVDASDLDAEIKDLFTDEAYVTTFYGISEFKFPDGRSAAVVEGQDIKIREAVQVQESFRNSDESANQPQSFDQQLVAEPLNGAESNAASAAGDDQTPDTIMDVADGNGAPEQQNNDDESAGETEPLQWKVDRMIYNKITEYGFKNEYEKVHDSLAGLSESGQFQKIQSSVNELNAIFAKMPFNQEEINLIKTSGYLEPDTVDIYESGIKRTEIIQLSPEGILSFSDQVVDVNGNEIDISSLSDKEKLKGTYSLSEQFDIKFDELKVKFNNGEFDNPSDAINDLNSILSTYPLSEEQQNMLRSRVENSIIKLSDGRQISTAFNVNSDNIATFDVIITDVDGNTTSLLKPESQTQLEEIKERFEKPLKIEQKEKILQDVNPLIEQYNSIEGSTKQHMAQRAVLLGAMEMMGLNVDHPKIKEDTQMFNDDKMYNDDGELNINEDTSFHIDSSKFNDLLEPGYDKNDKAIKQSKEGITANTNGQRLGYLFSGVMRMAEGVKILKADQEDFDKAQKAREEAQEELEASFKSLQNDPRKPSGFMINKVEGAEKDKLGTSISTIRIIPFDRENNADMYSALNMEEGATYKDFDFTKENVDAIRSILKEYGTTPDVHGALSPEDEAKALDNVGEWQDGITYTVGQGEDSRELKGSIMYTETGTFILQDDDGRWHQKIDGDNLVENNGYYDVESGESKDVPDEATHNYNKETHTWEEDKEAMEVENKQKTLVGNFAKAINSAAGEIIIDTNGDDSADVIANKIADAMKGEDGRFHKKFRLATDSGTLEATDTGSIWNLKMNDYNLTGSDFDQMMRNNPAAAINEFNNLDPNLLDTESRTGLTDIQAAFKNFQSQLPDKAEPKEKTEDSPEEESEDKK